MIHGASDGCDETGDLSMSDKDWVLYGILQSNAVSVANRCLSFAYVGKFRLWRIPYCNLKYGAEGDLLRAPIPKRTFLVELKIVLRPLAAALFILVKLHSQYPPPTACGL